MRALNKTDQPRGGTSSLYKPRRVVAKNALLGCLENRGANARDGVGPFAVGMGVVGGVHDALVADGADDVGQGFFTGLAGDDHAARGK